MDPKKIKVNQDLCIGCGTCPMVAPGTFKMNDDYKAEVLDEVTDDEATIQQAMDSCPVQAITLS